MIKLITTRTSNLIRTEGILTGLQTKRIYFLFLTKNKFFYIKIDYWITGYDRKFALQLNSMTEYLKKEKENVRD